MLRSSVMLALFLILSAQQCPLSGSFPIDLQPLSKEAQGKAGRMSLWPIASCCRLMMHHEVATLRLHVKERNQLEAEG